MTTVVLGAGAMGSLVAGSLAAAGFPVILLGRPSAHLATIATDDLQIESPDGSSRGVLLQVTTDPRIVQQASTLLVLVKAWATTAAVAPIARFLPTSTLVVTLQNGLGNRERIAAAAPDHPEIAFVAGVTSQSALHNTPGIVRHTGRGPTLLGMPNGAADPRLTALATQLSASGLEASIVADVDRAIWQKVAVNAAINGLTALGNVANGMIVSDPELNRAARAIATEVAAVAATQGFSIDEAAETALATAAATAANHSSMLRDFDRGRQTEVDAIYGAVVEWARAAGTDAPLCATLAAIIRAREQSPRAVKGSPR